MEWVAAVVAFVLAILSMLCAVGIGYELCRRTAWRAGFESGEAAWRSNQERCDADKARVAEAERDIACREKMLADQEEANKWTAKHLNEWNAALNAKQKSLEAMGVTRCTPSYYEQLVAPCMN